MMLFFNTEFLQREHVHWQDRFAAHSDLFSFWDYLAKWILTSIVSEITLQQTLYIFSDYPTTTKSDIYGFWYYPATTNLTHTVSEITLQRKNLRISMLLCTLFKM